MKWRDVIDVMMVNGRHLGVLVSQCEEATLYDWPFYDPSRYEVNPVVCARNKFSFGHVINP